MKKDKTIISSDELNGIVKDLIDDLDKETLVQLINEHDPNMYLIYIGDSMYKIRE